jgi:D-alanyl-lipoteichoic acid acyltransferase DltB (MBOAT superfamily)
VGLAFCVLGYLCARAAPGRRTAPLVGSLVGLTLVFVFLRGYTLFGAPLLPDSLAARVIGLVGLSFLFFKVIHVVVDAAGGTIERLPFTSYLNYCLNFTTVAMGPIQRYQDFAAQWHARPGETLGFEAQIDAANRVLRGLLKAFALAPFLAPFALAPGLSVETAGAGELVLAIYLFYIVLYLDFSGYCDIVIGVGTLMGICPPARRRTSGSRSSHGTSASTGCACIDRSRSG